ncbi:MAG: hypothetical protein J5I90_06455 [Caldilineales bacterium]|nr:hypothetical protein [Caldilineales bacterium]
MSRKRRPRPPEPPEALALRQELAAVILAGLHAPTAAEWRRLTARRNELGRKLAHLLKRARP